MTFEERLNNISNQFGLSNTKRGEGHLIMLSSIDGYVAKLDIGPDELEWYLTIEKESLKKPYSDWIDYAGYNDRSKEELINDKLEDIEHFLKNWTTAESINVEIKESLFGLFKSAKAYWKISGIWSKIELTGLLEYKN